MLIAALCADGVTEIGNVRQIDRGYERIDERLRELGARITRRGRRARHRVIDPPPRDPSSEQPRWSIASPAAPETSCPTRCASFAR